MNYSNPNFAVTSGHMVRKGATLTEVLMATLIMGIGLVGVISLFPASVLRAVQAHALTTSANLRFNAESQLALYPQILANPARRDKIVQFHQQPGVAFMVDPLGIIAHALGDGDQVAGPGSILRHSAGFVLPTNPTTLTPITESVFSCPDKWTVLYEDFPTNGSVRPTDNPQTLTFTKLDKQAVYIGTGTAPARAVIFNRAGDACQVRDIEPALPVNSNSPLGNTIGWTNLLPTPYSAASFGASDIGKVRIEQRDLTFSWLLTGKQQRSTSGTSRYTYSIVLFHKRSFAPSDLDSFTNGTNLVFTAGSNEANLTYSSGSPFLKRGGYVLDATSDSTASNGYWYRIQDYEESPGGAKIFLDTPARANGKIAVFMKGIVAVYNANDKDLSAIPAGFDQAQ